MITAQEQAFVLRLREAGVRTRGPWEEEVRQYRNVQRDSLFYRDRVLPAGPYDAGATGRLTIELNPASYGGTRRFSDRQTSALEERLPHLFREIEEQIVRAKHDAEDRQGAAERAEAIAEEEAQERHRTWLVLMDRAADGLRSFSRLGNRSVHAWIFCAI